MKKTHRVLKKETKRLASIHKKIRQYWLGSHDRWGFDAWHHGYSERMAKMRADASRAINKRAKETW